MSNKPDNSSQIEASSTDSIIIIPIRHDALTTGGATDTLAKGGNPSDQCATEVLSRSEVDKSRALSPQEKKIQSAEKIADCKRENQERKPRSENSQMKE